MASRRYRAWVNETTFLECGRTPPSHPQVVTESEKTKIREPDASSNNFDKFETAVILRAHEKYRLSY
jgi:hypothetical protein